MSLRGKLLILVLFVGLVPTGVSLFTALRVHRRAYEGKLVELQQSSSRWAASAVHTWQEHTVATLSSAAGQIPWSTLSDVERDGALSIVYEQLDAIALVQLVDPQGSAIGGALFTESGDSRFPEHPRLSGEDLERLVEHLPTARSDEATWGQAFEMHDRSALLVVISLPVLGRPSRWHLLVGLSLKPLCRAARFDHVDGLTFSILDPWKRNICSPDASQRLHAVSVPEGNAADTATPLFSQRQSDGRLLRIARSDTPHGWTVLAQVPESVAVRPARALRTQTLLWLAVSLGIALLAGGYLARSISAPVKELTQGAETLAAGDLSHRLQVRSRDELGTLADAFNTMGTELEKRDLEIRAWNAELEERVDARTRELTRAQEQLLQTQTIAAMSSLAAGMAHEINNPLTVVLGMTQVLRKRARTEDGLSPRERMLSNIEDEAKRIRDIVNTLQELVRQPERDDFTQLECNHEIVQALELLQARAEQSNVEIACGLTDEPVPIMGDAGKLREVLLHLLNNALAATDRGDRIDVSTKIIENKLVSVCIADTGTGIAPDILDRIFEPFFTTKTDWSSRGLGLTVVRRILEAHQGNIHIESELGVGTEVTVTLPIARGGSHLV